MKLFEKKNRSRCILLAVVLVVVGIFVYQRHYGPLTRTAVVEEMEQARLALQAKDIDAIREHGDNLLKIAERIKDEKLKQRTVESAHLLYITSLAMAGGHDNELMAIKLFRDRLDANSEARRIFPEAFAESLPYAKYHISKMFFNSYDMQGAHLFTVTYPPVDKGKDAKYFEYLDRLIGGDIEGAERDLKILLEKEPDHEMAKDTLAYIGRMKEKGIKPKTDERTKIILSE